MCTIVKIINTLRLGCLRSHTGGCESPGLVVILMHYGVLGGGIDIWCPGEIPGELVVVSGGDMVVMGLPNCS